MSGFVSKLFAMVNESPNDVVDWVPSGDAFQILDLTRLESQTLPLHFRHSRFQSLVRQLNFYNFRKVNRERTFWVYKHPLFHRDKPDLLPHLRRKTCPGVDGRRSKDDPSVSSSGSKYSSADSNRASGTRTSSRVGRPPRNHDAYTPVGNFTTGSHGAGDAPRSNQPPQNAVSTSAVGGGGNGGRGGAVHGQDNGSEGKKGGGGVGQEKDIPGYGHLGGSRPGSPSFDLNSSFDEAYSSHNNKRKYTTAPPTTSSTSADHNPYHNTSNTRAERSERSQMVASVSQQLEAYAKRARTASRDGSVNGSGSGRSTPTFMGKGGNGGRGEDKKGVNSTMRFHALTYDDSTTTPSISPSPPSLQMSTPSSHKTLTTTLPGSTSSSTPIHPLGPVQVPPSTTNFSTSFNQIPKTPSSAFCPKLTISLPTNPDTDPHPSIHESSPHYATLSKSPIPDHKLTTAIASKISKVSPETNAALTRFCLSTPPTAILDPKTKGERLEELFRKDDRVKEDFNRYRDALSPRSALDWCGVGERTGAIEQGQKIAPDVEKLSQSKDSIVKNDEGEEERKENVTLEGELNCERAQKEGKEGEDKPNEKSSAIAAAKAATAAALHRHNRSIDPRDFTPFCINHLRDTFKEGYEKNGNFTQREVEAVENAIKVWFRAAMVTQ